MNFSVSFSFFLRSCNHNSCNACPFQFWCNQKIITILFGSYKLWLLLFIWFCLFGFIIAWTPFLCVRWSYLCDGTQAKNQEIQSHVFIFWIPNWNSNQLFSVCVNKEMGFVLSQPQLFGKTELLLKKSFFFNFFYQRKNVLFNNAWQLIEKKTTSKLNEIFIFANKTKKTYSQIGKRAVQV